MRGRLLCGVGIAVVLIGTALVGPLAVQASGRTVRAPKYVGAAPGSVTCSLSVKTSFSPPLTKSGGGTSPSAGKGTLSGCTPSNSALSITEGKVTGTFASSPLSCTTMSTTGAAASFDIAWKGSVNGVVGGTTYAGKATFAPTTVNGGSATGSFSGAVTTSVTIPSDLATLCGATKGIKKVDLSGIVHLDGNPIVKPTLTITASDGTQTYGGSPPTITPSYSGFVNSDGPGDLTAAPTCVSNTAGSTPAAFYPGQSSCSGAVDPNYTISYANGDITVKPATLTITASDGTQTYGGSPPTITPSYSGLVNGDTSPAVPPTCASNTDSSTPAAFYPGQSSCSGAVDPNYTISYANGDITVKPATLTVTANHVTKVFGSPDPALTFVSSGLIDSDTTTGHLTRNPGENPGSYQITLGTLTAGPNYTIVYIGNTFTIEP